MKPVIAVASLLYVAVPSVSVSVPVPSAVVRLATAVVVRDACPVASWLTVTDDDSPASFAPDSADAVRTLLFDDTGCVCSVPPVASAFSAAANWLTVLISVDVPEICAVMAVDFWVSASVLAANCAWTSELTSDAVSTPEPLDSEVKSACAAEAVTLLALGVVVGTMISPRASDQGTAGSARFLSDFVIAGRRFRRSARWPARRSPAGPRRRGR